MSAIPTALAKESNPATSIMMDTDSFASGSGHINFAAFDEFIKRQYFFSFLFLVPKPFGLHILFQRMIHLNLSSPPCLAGHCGNM
jgi:hypothetical protein